MNTDIYNKINGISLTPKCDDINASLKIKIMENKQDSMLSLSDVIKFIDWVSDKSYKRCANGEWIQIGTGDYKTVAKNTIELYELFKNNK